MKVGLLIITHAQIGEVLLHSAVSMLGGVSPLPCEVLAAPHDCDIEATLERAEQAINKLDQGDGVLVLTDIFGATPCNIVSRLYFHHPIRIVSGINLPMLIRVLNYPQLGLDQLAKKAVSGGRDGITIYHPDV